MVISNVGCQSLPFSKLVFMVEARPAVADAARLHPGQPVSVQLK